VAVFEEKIRLLEGGEACTSASTGMAAISNMLHALLRPGDTRRIGKRHFRRYKPFVYSILAGVWYSM
jgi:cystathionine beta-lyase/cystathionine gamma-synthase